MTTLIHTFGGNIGIGTNDPGSYRLRVEGGIKADSVEINGVSGGNTPIGLIAIWYGNSANVPTGWHVCDGTTGITRTDGGGTIDVPDLRDRFIRGAGGDADPSPTTVTTVGGANTVTLTEANLASHAHPTGNQSANHTHPMGNPNANHSHPVSAGNISNGHSHNHNAQAHPNTRQDVSYNWPGSDIRTDWGNRNTNDQNANHSHPVSAGNVNHWHTHPMGNQSANHTHPVGNTGSGTAVTITNPFYALYYIMKV
jgi:microcystin-dependent protein